MSGEIGIWDDSYIAGADLTGKTGLAVKISAADTVVLCGAGEAGIGILVQDATATHAVSVRLLGRAMCTVNGNSVNIAAGDPLKSAANGVLVKAATNNDIVIGRAEEAATADGMIIPVTLGVGPYYLGA